MAADIQGCNPFRRGYWRWERAQELFTGQRKPYRLEDPTVRRVLHYLRALNRATTPRGKARVEKQFEPLHTARLIFVQDDVTCWRLKAMLLTDESTDRIGAQLDLDPAVVRMFELVFHNVHKDNHPASFDWIILRVIGGDRWDPLNPPPVVVWMYMALAAGPVALKVLVDQYLGVDDPSIRDRALIAARARWMVMWHFANWDDVETARYVLRETRKLFPIGEPEEEPIGPSRLMALMIKTIELRYCRYGDERDWPEGGPVDLQDTADGTRKKKPFTWPASTKQAASQGEHRHGRQA